MNYSTTQNHSFTDIPTDCTPLASLDRSQLALAIAVIVVASLAIGFLLFVLYLTCREAKIAKYNIRRLSDIERESFSKRRTSQGCGGLEQTARVSGDSRRLTLDDLYDSILPQYAADDLDLDMSSPQETQRMGSVAWQLEEDPDPDQRSDDPEVVLRQLIFPGEFQNSFDSRQRATQDGASGMPSRKASSVKKKVKRSIHQVRYSLHSTSSIVDVEAKSSLASFTELQHDEDAKKALPEQSHQLSLGPFNEFGRNRRNGSVPAQLNNHNNTISISSSNNNNERKAVGILRRNSSRLQTDFEHRMKQRRVAVSFNSSQAQFREFSPNDFVQKQSQDSGV